jgi:hypothetical protein
VPTCGITVSPLPARAGKPVTVDLSGSRVAAGVKGGVKSAKVEVVNSKGDVVDTFELSGGSLSRNDVVIKKGGIHTLRAVVTDEANQASTNECTAQVDVKGGLPIFASAFFGKERMTHDSEDEHGEVFLAGAAFSRCAPLFGLSLGIQPMIGDNTQLEAGVGVKFPIDEDDAHTGFIANLAVNRVLSRGFFGGGVSYWGGKDSGGLGPLVQGGLDLDKDGKWQLVTQGRMIFSELDNIDNNYQFWGGIRFRPNAYK